MGWKTSLGIVADTHLDELGVGGPTVPFNLVAPGQAGFAQVGRDVVVVEPMTMDPCVMSIGARLGRQTYCVVLESTSSTYVIQAGGPIQRNRRLQGGRLVIDQGRPLPAEARLAGADDDETAHITVFDDLLPAGASDAAVLDLFHRRLHGFDMRMRSGFIRRDLRKAGIRNYKAVEIVVLSTAPASSGMIAAIDHANTAFEARSVMVSYRQVP